MAGEQPPNKNRGNSSSRDNQPDWRENYYGASSRPSARRPSNQPANDGIKESRESREKESRNGNANPTWRPNTNSEGKPYQPPSASGNGRARTPLPPDQNSPRQGQNRNGNVRPAREEADPRPRVARQNGADSRQGQNYRPLPPSAQSPDANAARKPSPPRFSPNSSPVAAPSRTRRPRKGSTARSVALYGGITLLVIFIIGTLFAITRISSFVNGITVPRVDQNGAPVSGTGGGGRVNVLLMGLDLRPNDQNDGTRSDTMILVSIDQNHKAASMLSIPRDLWVDIPGHGTNRVNAAYNFGDQDKPGTGGPPLAKATVSNLLGVSVDYFVQVDFNGFRQIVDAIGGITIDVKKPLVDNEYPTEDFGIKRIYIPAGIQHMDGQTALEYARSRHGDTDLGRNQRQQAVLLAIREQGINLGAVTNNELQQALQGAIKTDLQTTDILGLVQTGIGMNKDNIRSYSIDANLAKQTFIDGNDVLLPDKEGIRALVRQMLNPPVTTTGTSATAGTKETATINVLNGTFTAGLASRTQQFLEGKGYTINGVEQAGDAGQYPRSIIRVYNGKQKTASELAGLLGISSGQIQVKSGGPPGVDIEIVCGEDLKIPQ